MNIVIKQLYRLNNLTIFLHLEGKQKKINAASKKNYIKKVEILLNIIVKEILKSELYSESKNIVF